MNVKILDVEEVLNELNFITYQVETSLKHFKKDFTWLLEVNACNMVKQRTKNRPPRSHKLQSRLGISLRNAVPELQMDGGAAVVVIH